MSTQQTRDSDQAVRNSLSFLQDLLVDYHPRDFAVRLWDGSRWDAEPGQPTRFTLVLRHPGALRKMFWPPNELTLVEAYLYDDFDIEGELEAVFPLTEHLMEQRRGLAQSLRQVWHLLRLPSEGRRRLGRLGRTRECFA